MVRGGQRIPLRQSASFSTYLCPQGFPIGIKEPEYGKRNNCLRNSFSVRRQYLCKYRIDFSLSHALWFPSPLNAAL